MLSNCHLASPSPPKHLESQVWGEEVSVSHFIGFKKNPPLYLYMMCKYKPMDIY